MTSIFILGAGVMQGPAIQAARNKGYHVAVADGDPNAIHARDADVFFNVDLKDREGLAAAAASVPNLRGVFTAGTDFSASVAWVAERLGLASISYETALDASDKARMRARLEAAGVPVPGHAVGSKGDDPEILATGSSGRTLSYPVVVKPVDNMGARGCRLARDRHELAHAWTDALAHSRSGRAIVEEYLDGPEFSVDALVHGGSIVIRGLADRHVYFAPYFVELGHTMPSAYGADVQAEVLAVFQAAVRALGITTGAAKGDIKYTRRGAFVGEIAARLSGGFMSGWTYPYASGVDPAAEAIDLACGVTPAFQSPTRDWVSAERAWISIPGTVAEVRMLDAARRLPYVKDVFPRLSRGDRAVFPSNNVQKAGNVISQAPDRASAEQAAERGARAVLIRLEPGDPDTLAFLDGAMDIRSDSGQLWPPPAYQPSAMALASADKLPDLVRNGGEGTTVSIAPLRGLDGDTSTDWLGRTLPETLDAVRELTGARVGDHGDLVLGRRFWKALFRGGYQAGAWVVDSARRGGDR
ncbi:MAG: ATP-grasp domain-containing protein [Spirochaetia bacterium]|nr:ATP-grasp domain-containing protein [Spirochaetia bacterium]